MDEGMKPEEAKERFGNLNNMCQSDHGGYKKSCWANTVEYAAKLGLHWDEDMEIFTNRDPGDEHQ